MNSGMEGIPAIHGREEVKELLTITDGHCSVTSQRVAVRPRGIAFPEDPAAWGSIVRAQSNWLGHPDHYLPFPPSPRALPVPRRTERLAGEFVKVGWPHRVRFEWPHPSEICA